MLAHILYFLIVRHFVVVNLCAYCVEIECHQQNIKGSLFVGKVDFECGVGQFKQTLALIDL